jgi:predicted metal-binding transcription factor (methanogenesis marker protein 9)
LMSWFPPTARTPKGTGMDDCSTVLGWCHSHHKVTAGGGTHLKVMRVSLKIYIGVKKKLNLMVYQDLPQWHVWNSTALDHCVSKPCHILPPAGEHRLKNY